MKALIREWVYSLIFKLFSKNTIKRDSIVLGIVIGYINPNATRSAVQYLISDLPKESINESMVLNGVLMSSYLLPDREDSKELCGIIKNMDPNNYNQCKKIKTSFISRIIDISSSINLDSLVKSLNIIIKNNKKISNIAI